MFVTQVSIQPIEFPIEDSEIYRVHWDTSEGDCTYGNYDRTNAVNILIGQSKENTRTNWRKWTASAHTTEDSNKKDILCKVTDVYSQSNWFVLHWV